MSRGMLFMATSATAFSLMAVCVKLGAGLIPEQELILFRSLFIIAVVLPILKRKGVPLLGVNRKLLVARGLMGYVAMSCYFWTLGEFPVADAMAVQYMSPLFTILWAGLFLGEKLTGRVGVAALVCVAGMLMIVRPEGGGELGAGLIGLLGAMLAGGAYTSVRALRRTEDPYTVVLYFPLVSLPLSGIASIREWVTPSGVEEWMLILGVCLFSYIGQVFLTKGMAEEEAPRAIIVNYLSVGFGLLFGIALFDTIPLWTSILGIVLILGGISAISRR